MAAAPTTSWNLVRLYGTWRMNGSLIPGTYKITIPARITNHTDDTIIPAGVFASGPLQTAVTSSPSLDVMVPATDDPDNDQTGWNLQVEITFTGAVAGEKYSLAVPVAARPIPDGGSGAGVNLRTVVLPTQLPQSVAFFRAGVPGGLAKLNEQGQVEDSQGNPVLGTGSGSVNSVNGVTPDNTGALIIGKANISGLDLVDNTHDAVKAVLSATKWATARTLSLTGGVTGSVSIDGTANASLSTTVAGGTTGKALLAASAPSDAWGQLGLVPTANLPALAINDTFTVANQAARLALTAQRGDMAYQSDNSTWYILAADAPATDANWKAISVPALVQSVNGQTGVVALSASDVGITTGTTAAAGLVALATTAQANAGTDTTHAVTPAGLSQILAAIAGMPIMVQWDGTTWGTYSNDPTRVRMFLSQNDTAAPKPTAYNAHDLWFGASL